MPEFKKHSTWLNKPSVIKSLVKEIVDLVQTANYFINKDNYTCLLERNNPELFIKLTEAGFFDFHVTNNGHIIGFHQVILYCTKGYKHYLKGFKCREGEVEVHHLSSNPQENHPENLVYVTPLENKMCAQVVQGKYLGKVLSYEIGTFDHISPKLRLAELLKQTFEATLKVEGKGVIHFLMNLPSEFRKEVLVNWRITV